MMKFSDPTPYFIYQELDPAVCFHNYRSKTFNDIVRYTLHGRVAEN